MAKKQTAESMGFPSGNRGDSRPVVRRRPMPGGKTKGLGGGKAESKK